jgi:phage repressor protein C with HTH and peptisase S24 domain
MQSLPFAGMSPRAQAHASAFESTLLDLLDRGIGVRFRATGDSMHPSIRWGEHLHVTPVVHDSLREGDIILARAHRGLTAHRIVRVGRAGIVTRGDNCLRPDPILHPHTIVGRVAHLERDQVRISVPPPPSRARVLLRHVVRCFVRSS